MTIHCGDCNSQKLDNFNEDGDMRSNRIH